MNTSSPPAGITVRYAAPSDAESLNRLVRSLAEYEKLPPPDPAAQKRLVRDILSTPPRIQALIAEYEGTAAGYALIFETYSSFLALPSLYLEDLFVLPEYRKRGAGRELFLAVVREAHTRGCGRVEWAVLDWNRLALGFYEKLGARHMKDWQLFRLLRPDMERLLFPHT